MKSTSCDSVGLTTDLYACVIELKEERPVQRDLERLWLAIAMSPGAQVSDEQILSLP